MIPVPSGARVWLASGHTDMRKGLMVWRCWYTFAKLRFLVQRYCEKDA